MKLLIVETEAMRDALVKCLHDGWKIAVSGTEVCCFGRTNCEEIG